MARKKFKLSKSLLARLVAIGVLSGLGGFAIYQSQFSEPAEDEAGEIADADDSETTSEEEAGASDSIKIPDSVADSNDPAKAAINKAFESRPSGSSSPGLSGGSSTIRVAALETDSPPPVRPGIPSSLTGSTNRDGSSSSGDTPKGSSSNPLAMPGSSPRHSSSSNSSESSRSPANSLSLPPTQPPSLTTKSPANDTAPPTRPSSTPSQYSMSDSTPTQPPTMPDRTSTSLSDMSSRSGDSDRSASEPNGIARPDGQSNGLRSSSAPGSSPVDSTPSAEDANAPGRLASLPSDTSPMSTTEIKSPSGTGSPTMPDSGLGMSDRNRSISPPPSQSPTSQSLRDSSSPGSQPSAQAGSGMSNGMTGRQAPGGDPSSREEIGYGGSSGGLNNSGSRSPGNSPGYGGGRNESNEIRTYGSMQDSASAPRSSQDRNGTGSTYGGGVSSSVGGSERYGNNSYGSGSTGQTSPQRDMPRSNGIVPQAADSVSDTPGGKDMEGTQAPSLALEKRAPREVQVGRVANFETVIRNVGRTEASDVIVTDRIPAGTRLENVHPKPISEQGGLLIWNLGTMKPGQEQVITMNLVPERKGEIGSVAQVTFNAQASVRTVSTQPRLEMQVEGPEQVLIGQNATLRITIKNSGDGAATNVVIEEDVPAGLSHPEGRELQYPVGTLAPGEVRQLALTLRAESAAAVRNRVIARGDNNLVDEKLAEFEIVAPSLQIAMSGPSKRYLERTAIHRIKIENSGTASATNVEIVAHLPKGLKFQETNNHGTYDPASHAVYWGLESLPPGTSDDSIQLVTLPVETGEQNIEYRVAADLNLSDGNRMPVMVEELAELFFDIDDVADPIEVDSETLYHLRVTNQGSKVATRVRIQVSFPPELQPINAEGPVDHQMQQQAIVFAPIERIAPGEEMLFKIQAKARREGDHRVSVTMISDDSSEPVMKQASTNVYRDR